MKKIIAILLLGALLIAASGCALGSRSRADSVTFYFLRTVDSFAYGSQDAVIAPETREAAGHIGDTGYLLALYLNGPSTVGLRSPFPTGCRLISVHLDGDTLYVQLSPVFTQLENMDLTLACACMAKTCMSITDAAQVCIESAEPDGRSISVTMGADDLLLFDDCALPEETSGVE